MDRPQRRLLHALQHKVPVDECIPISEQNSTHGEHLVDLGFPAREVRDELVPGRIGDPLTGIDRALCTGDGHEADPVQISAVRDWVRDDVLCAPPSARGPHKYRRCAL